MLRVRRALQDRVRVERLDLAPQACVGARHGDRLIDLARPSGGK
jgi:hypothetical protein